MSIVIEFVFHHRLSAISDSKILMDVQDLSTGLQNQSTGYSDNLAGVASPNVSHGVHIHISPYRLLPVAYDPCG